MFRREVTELLNTREAWVFVGAGASCDAGAPNWQQLVETTASNLLAGFDVDMNTDPRFSAAVRARNYPKAFSRIQAKIGRPQLEDIVRTELLKNNTPGEVLKTLANWPAAGYITTNYDTLIQTSLAQIGQASGWVRAGNSDSEVRKLSGNPQKVVWHVHGAIGSDPDKFKLILTEEDYEALYLEESKTVKQLGALLMQRQVILVGFGFTDPELLRLLKIVRGYSNPARPIYAFIGSEEPLSERELRSELFEQYNVDAIPYLVTGHDHSQLRSLLNVYSSFVLRRTQRFDAPGRQCPSYDSTTTALLVYNALALGHRAQLTNDIIDLLLKSRILSLLKFSGPQTAERLKGILLERVRLIGKQPTIKDENALDSLISGATDRLIGDGLVSFQEAFVLTDQGVDFLDSQASASKLMHEQFQSCLVVRAEERLGAGSASSSRVAKAAEAFLLDTIDKRALGLAMVNFQTHNVQQYHIVALLQNLPKFLEPLSEDEALALIGLVQDFLSRPTNDESRYLGVALQAQFSLNLLGYDPELVRGRVSALSKTLFLLDSSTILHLIARSSAGSEAAALLVKNLRDSGSPLASTQLLIREVAEHARWAAGHLSKYPVISVETLMSITGRAGYRQNLFLEAFIREINRGASTLDFGVYLDSISQNKGGHLATDEVFRERAEQDGIEVHEFEEWDGFQAKWFSERDELQDEIAEIRRGKKTYKHDRQTQAEAEAVIIIERLRSGEISVDGAKAHDAYFISNTRIVDRIKEARLPITMSPSAALQWFSTMTPLEPEELAALTTSIIWELGERGYEVLDRKSLQQAFGPLIDASKESEANALAHHSSLIANEYGEDSAQAFANLSDLDLPVALHVASVRRATDLQKELARTRAERDAAEAKAKMTEKEKKEYEKLKGRQLGKHRKSVSKQRGARAKKKGKKR